MASRIRHPPESFELVVTDDPEEQGRVHIDARGTYADAAAAESARRLGRAAVRWASFISRMTRPFSRLIRVARQVARGDIQRATQSINELLESEEIPDDAEQAEEPEELPELDLGPHLAGR